MKFESFAHGCVNLMGDCADESGGWGLPTTIPQKTHVRLERRTDPLISAESDAFPQQKETYRLGEEVKTNGWIDVLQGITQRLSQDGHRIGGFDARVQSSVPVNFGLGSSAALGVSFLKTLRSAYDLKISDVAIAQIVHRSEMEFSGRHSGITDAMACALVRVGEALFLDTKELSFDRVSLPVESMDVILLDSGVRPASAIWAERVEESLEAARILEVRDLRALTDITQLDRLSEPLKRRARHVVSENMRVREAAQALRARDLKRLGELFLASHRSLRDDFAASTEELDALISLCQAQGDFYGARVNRGGVVVAITKPRRSQEAADSVLRSYARQFPALNARVLV